MSELIRNDIENLNFIIITNDGNWLTSVIFLAARPKSSPKKNTLNSQEAHPSVGLVYFALMERHVCVCLDVPDESFAVDCRRHCQHRGLFDHVCGGR